MATFYFDPDSNGLVRGDVDGPPNHRLSVLENDGDLILRVEANGASIDLYLSNGQAKDFLAACNDVGDRMRLIWTDSR
jgi:hypothetical protein